MRPGPRLPSITRTAAPFLLAGLLCVLPSQAKGQVPTDPLAQMELAFVGNFTRAQIKARLDRAMKLYEVPLTAENYSRAGSALVALRREVGPREMDILSYMIRSHVPGVRISFPEAAGLAAAFMAPGQHKSSSLEASPTPRGVDG